MSNEQTDWFGSFTEYFMYFCWCCIPPSKRAKDEGAIEDTQLIKSEDDEEIKDDGQITSVCNRAHIILRNRGRAFDFGRGSTVSSHFVEPALFLVFKMCTLSFYVSSLYLPIGIIYCGLNLIGS